MNKTDIVDVIAAKTGFTKADSAKALTAVEEAIVEELQRGGKVQLVGFGSFDILHRSARKGINPRTRDEIDIPASNSPRFKAGKSFKDAVNG